MMAHHRHLVCDGAGVKQEAQEGLHELLKGLLLGAQVAVLQDERKLADNLRGRPSLSMQEQRVTHTMSAHCTGKRWGALVS